MFDENADKTSGLLMTPNSTNSRNKEQQRALNIPTADVFSQEDQNIVFVDRIFDEVRESKK